jgi:predicted nuclease of restriction endonuclease-like RecB superfamily
MLTRDLAIAEYDFARGRLIPDRLTRKQHPQYLAYADRMLQVYARGKGRTRRELHQSVHGIFASEVDCPLRRIDAFCKLLDDAAAFERDRHGRAAALRREVFHLAAASHPLVRRADKLFERTEHDVKSEIAARLGRTWSEIDRDLFSDVIEFHRLSKFDSFADGAALLARYNVAQVQAALFDAVAMTIWATDDFKTILRYAKLARLMHTITRAGEGQYRLRLDGPASLLRETRRYGTAMARFLPALVACRGWRMHAVIRRRTLSLALELSEADRLTSHLPPPEEYDSDIEESFARKWGAEPREGWRLVREGEILHQGQKVFVPDFAFHHERHGTVLMEIVGFWTPEYLQAKLDTLRVFRDCRIVLAVAESVAGALPQLPPHTIRFKTALRIQDVLERLKLYV